MIDPDNYMDELDLPLRVSVTESGYAVYPPRAVWGPRMSAEFEFVWILDGQVQWVCDDVPHPIGPGDVVLVRPGMRDLFRWDRNRITRHAYFHFQAPDVTSLPHVGAWPLVRSMTPEDIIRPLFRFVLSEPAHTPPGWQSMRDREAATILWTFVHDAFALPGIGTSAVHPLVDRALAYIHDAWPAHPLRSITLEELADAATVTPPHLCRVFSRTLGHSPMEIVRLMRVYWGAMALAWSDLSVAQVAVGAGIPDQFHFSRRFREVYGMPPSAFRRRYGLGSAYVDSLPAGAAMVAARLWGGREIDI